MGFAPAHALSKFYQLMLTFSFKPLKGCFKQDIHALRFVVGFKEGRGINTVLNQIIDVLYVSFVFECSW
ncbi:MAG: hypothetical protein BWY72_00644 [Bacteroidetes bacterium ADurb.Bin416]|nr:MAG: hypothetical protein BWY72_00644 [Bacteroidetes bacterium ADurb.Bin416]